MPAPDAMAKATLAKIRDAHEGATFDRDYITAQVENHKFLRALATAYLKNAPEETREMAELQGQHLATLALATFKEHVLLTECILDDLRA